MHGIIDWNGEIPASSLPVTTVVGVPVHVSVAESTAHASYAVSSVELLTESVM